VFVRCVLLLCVLYIMGNDMRVECVCSVCAVTMCTVYYGE
jgi:hypothetical protein